MSQKDWRATPRLAHIPAGCAELLLVGKLDVEGWDSWWGLELGSYGAESTASLT
jgi:hypothetical protein